MKKKTKIKLFIIAAALITMACTCPLTNLVKQFTNPEPEDLLEMLPENLLDELPEDIGETLEQIVTAVPEVVEEGMDQIPESLGEGDMQNLFNQGVPENIPMVEEYEDLLSMGGVMSYNTPIGFTQMVAFYEENLVAYGWTKDTSVINVDLESAALNYFNETQTLTLAIAVVNDITTVSIIVVNK